MRIQRISLLALTVVLSSCGPNRRESTGPPPMSPRQEFAVDVDVRAFASDVARDITKEGPAAWRRHFSESPAFFMAADGTLQFPDSAAATAGIQALTRTIQHIELTWGKDLRVDPLARDLALIATPYYETIETAYGSRVESTGFFTGVVQFQDGHWLFRNAHWSSARPAAAP